MKAIRPGLHKLPASGEARFAKEVYGDPRFLKHRARKSKISSPLLIV